MSVSTASAQTDVGLGEEDGMITSIDELNQQLHQVIDREKDHSRRIIRVREILAELASRANGNFYLGTEASIVAIYQEMSAAFGGSVGIGR